MCTACAVRGDILRPSVLWVGHIRSIQSASRNLQDFVYVGLYQKHLKQAYVAKHCRYSRTNVAIILSADDTQGPPYLTECISSVHLPVALATPIPSATSSTYSFRSSQPPPTSRCIVETCRDNTRHQSYYILARALPWRLCLTCRLFPSKRVLTV